MPKEKDTLVSIEELIGMAMGPPTKNTVNFKLMQTILHILARQMRLLQTKVEIRIGSAEGSDEITQDDESDTTREESSDDEKSSKAKKKKAQDKTQKSKTGKKSKEDTEKDDEVMDGATDKDAKRAKRGSKSATDKPKDAKEKEKMEKLTRKERDKYLKEKELEANDEEDEDDDEEEGKESGKTSAKKRKDRAKKSAKGDGKRSTDKEDEDKERSSDKGRKSKEKITAGGGTIAISEAQRDHEKYLVVEKGAASTSGSRTRVGSIEVVTRSQFETLRSAVELLRRQAAPPPMPSLPDDKKLLSELRKGSASLTDTMQAMQVSARVQAAEEAITRMAGMLTQLAAAGALPPEALAQLEHVKSDLEAIHSLSKAKTTSRKSVGIEKEPPSKPHKETFAGVRPSLTGAPPSVASIASKGSSGVLTSITHNDLDDAIQKLKDDLMKSLQVMTQKGTAAAEMACGITRGIADKLEIAINLNKRISSLFALTSDYAEQLSGFDSGISTQMQSFQEQIIQMRGDLKEGLLQLSSVNNNAETAAVVELTERYEGLTLDLDSTALAHQQLAGFQNQLSNELRSLVEAIEMMREEKADRDEVLDGLRDKADMVRLAGLMTETEFTEARRALDMRLELCYDKFRRQDLVWVSALSELSQASQTKAELMRLMALKDEVQKALRALQERVALLATQLGEPKAAILMRLLSRDGRCAACRSEALMKPAESASWRPPALPALRPPPAEPCAPTPVRQQHLKCHVCNRWVGGSHTLVDRATPREAARLRAGAPAPARRYLGVGDDGRLYKMQEELVPCAECNVDQDAAAEAGAGDIPPEYRVGAGDPAVTTLDNNETGACECAQLY